jgi:uncharacterized protein
VKNAIFERLVEFPNRSGKKLRGMLHLAAAKGRTPGVVLFHAFTGNRLESHAMFVKCSRALAQAGIASLRFDFYGSGESEGEFREMSLRGEIADGRSAVAFFRQQPGIDPDSVGLLGFCLGGAVGAALALSVEAKAVVLWNAIAHTAHLRELIQQAAKKITGKAGASEFEAREISPRLIEDILKVEPTRHLRRFQGATLILHTEKNEKVPVSHARDFYQAAGANAKEIAIIPGADHFLNSTHWQQEAIARTVRWFARHLLQK